MTAEIVIATGLFLLLMAGIARYGYRRYARPVRILERIGGPVEEQRASQPREAATVRILRRLGGLVPVSPGDASRVRKLVIEAGYRSESAVTVFYGIKVAMGAAALPAALALMDLFGTAGSMRVVLVAAFVGMGYFLPTILLERRIARRHDILRLSLPDALDLMVVSVEAGLGLDQAIQHVSRELRMAHPEISEEWSLVNLEMRAGTRRADALRHLADRTGEPELRKLVAILVQNDRFGTSMAESLRTHSDFLRTRRRQEAEERAGKVGVKLIFPIFLFILPSMMVVTAGPAILQLFKNLFPLMGSVK